MYAFTADSKITCTTLPNTHNIPSAKSPEWIEHILQGEMLYTRPYVVLNHRHMSLGGPRGRRVREGRRHVVGESRFRIWITRPRCRISAITFFKYRSYPPSAPRSDSRLYIH